jgi:choline dehydrogenase-like flavoprotein
MTARVFVLCLGGLENPRLLLLSNAVEKAGLGNRHDVVGRYFMEHPATQPSVFLPSDPELDLRLYAQRRRFMTWLSLRPETAEREEVGNFTAALVRMRKWRSPGQKSLDLILENAAAFDIPDDLGEHVQKVARDLDVIAEEATRGLFGCDEEPVYYAMIPSTEMSPNPSSRVTLGAERDRFGQPRLRLDIRVSELDRRTATRGSELLATELVRSGLGRVKVRTEEDEIWNAWRGRYHHMGTTRMHADPKRGVVDADCRVHGVSNLYVAGSSVFPTGGAGVPTLTIVALALRLADRLAGSR